MNYHPDLFVKNIGNASAKAIWQIVRNLEFGKIQYVEIVDGNNAFVAMESWDQRTTVSTRMKLYQGKQLLVYYSQKNFWNVYSYENRFAEEELHKKQIRIAIQKEVINKQKEKEKEREQKKNMQKKEIR
jgi:hypothetical protein